MARGDEHGDLAEALVYIDPARLSYQEWLEVGMALHEIRELLSFQDQPRQSCDWITALVQRHLANVDTQIAALTHLREHLASLLHACAGGKAADCGILAQLRKGESCRRCEEMQQQQDAAAGVRKQDAAEAVPTGKAGRKGGRSA